MEHSAYDVTIVPQGSIDNFDMEDPINTPWETSLADAVANGRLYIKNGKVEFEQVAQATYWHDEALLTVTSDGYEFNEDGEVTRDWRPSTNRAQSTADEFRQAWREAMTGDTVSLDDLLNDLDESDH